MCNIDKNRNRKKDFKMEIPLNLLKQHKNICQPVRDRLISDLLDNQIDFDQYCSSLKLTSEVADVKNKVEMVSKSNFCAMKEKNPNLFSDFILQDFVGAKITPRGHNAAYSRLVKHVNIALSKDTGPEVAQDSPSEVYSESDRLNLLSLGQKMKKFDLVVCVMGSNDTFNQQNKMCIIEKVKDNCESVGVIIDSFTDESKMREDLTASFEGSEVIHDFIHVKRDTVIESNGFKKQLMAVAISSEKFPTPKLFILKFFSSLSY